MLLPEERLGGSPRVRDLGRQIRLCSLLHCPSPDLLVSILTCQALPSTSVLLQPVMPRKTVCSQLPGHGQVCFGVTQK